ncbi:MAG: phosphoribosylanthranilate isomerase [Chthoniobacterales bacterium]
MDDSFFDPGALRVKICGVTNAADAALVTDAGADAIGINFFPGSKRCVELHDVRDWVAELPLTRVAVVVNATGDDIARIVDAACFDAIQFHGDETPDFCAECPIVWIRALRVSGPESLTHALEYATQSLLLDGFSTAGYGGTGTAVDIELARDFVRWNPGRQVILAGGLKPDNVAKVAHLVKPHAVDVAGGVERDGDPRRKDAAKVRAFVAAAREA